MKLSRRKLAHYAVDQLQAGSHDALREIAAYLVTENRTKEAPLLVRDIEAVYAERGTVVADVTTARELTDGMLEEFMAEIGTLTHAKQVHVRAATDSALLGGVRVQVPGAELDATIAGKLRKLRAAKV